MNDHQEQDIDKDQDDQLLELGTHLKRLFESNAGKREVVEARMLKNLRQYHGKYEPGEIPKEGSQLFVNITRNKTNAAAARLAEMLIPNDDKNWGIAPTPVPELVDKSSSTRDVEINENTVTTEGDLAKSEMQEARDSATKMEKEINDQLTECNYNASEREIIFHSCQLGTGILKGPVVVGKVKKVWTQVEGDVYQIKMVKDRKPQSSVVHPLNFYPDMSASCPEEMGFTFEKHFKSRKQLKKLALSPGYLKSQIKKVLRQDPIDLQDDTDIQQQIRDITGADSISEDTRYHVHEYHGPIKREWLEACGCEIEEEDDPFEEQEGMAIFVGDIVIKAMIHPMATEESLYDIFNWEEDESCVFGFGVPHQMENPQKVINSSWRMTMDNAGLTTGPQIVIDQDAIEPLDDNYTLKPRKVWIKKDKNKDINKIFATFNIESHQADLMNIFTMARQLADEETNLPLIAQGEQTDSVTKTAHGMSMLMNSANIVIRRAVKNFDDNITRPHIERYYDWNMEFNKKAEIKGDFTIDARGSSVLLQREQQLVAVQNLIQLAGQPPYSSFAEHEWLFRQYVKLNSFDEDQAVKSEEQIKEDANREPPQDPMIELRQYELQLRERRDQVDAQLKTYQVDRDFESKMAGIAVGKELKLETLYSQLGMDQQKLDMAERWEGIKAMNIQTELAIKQDQGSGI